MTNIHKFHWSEANLYQEDFRGYCTHLPSHQLSIKTLILSILIALSGGVAALAAILAIGLRPLETDFGIFARLAVIFLTGAGLIISYKRGFSTFTWLSVATFVVLSILLFIFRTSPLISAFSTIPFMFTAELFVLRLSGFAFASSRAISKRRFLALSISALLGIGIILFLFQPLMTYPVINWVYGLLAASILFTGKSIGWNAFDENTRFPGIAQQAIDFTTIGGISFHKTNLMEANFTGATLKHTDFRGADLTRTRWKDAKGLEFAQLGDTYLANPKIRQLVIKCEGRGEIFDGLDLTGVNLQEAKLQKASFIGANLNHSDLRNADLSGAILKQTQLENTDLSGAVLTGAYIEDWGITSTTKLENVQCEYVYMRVPTEENPNPLRKPDNEREIFADGEFADFIKPYFDTLDLYHRQNIDPRAISIALKNLTDNNPDAQLKFVAIEWRGDGINIRYTTAPIVNKSELSHEYFTDYAQISKELLGDIQRKFAAQDAEIYTMSRMVDRFIKTGTHIYRGETTVNSSDNSIHIKTGDNAAITGLSSGDGVLIISGNVTQAINKLPDSPSKSDQPNIKVLLTQLQQAIQGDTDLSDPDKSDLLEQVQALAEAKQTEEPAKREGLMRKAMKMFDATLKSLPETAKIVEACSKLLPLILTSLGFLA